MNKHLAKVLLTSSVLVAPLPAIAQPPALPDLTVSLSHTGNFTQGDATDTYQIVVTNVGASATTNYTTVTPFIPSGLTLTGLSGDGWACTVAPIICQRADFLAAGQSYPMVTATVSVSRVSPLEVVTSASVNGGGEANTANDTAVDPTKILPASAPLPDITPIILHSGDFTSGQKGALYLIRVTNVGLADTGSTVAATITIPAKFTLTSMTGTGWSCILATSTCTRKDALPSGSFYPTITASVKVPVMQPGAVTTSVAVQEGGEANTTDKIAKDPTNIK